MTRGEDFVKEGSGSNAHHFIVVVRPMVTCCIRGKYLEVVVQLALNICRCLSLEQLFLRTAAVWMSVSLV